MFRDVWSLHKYGREVAPKLSLPSTIFQVNQPFTRKIKPLCINNVQKNKNYFTGQNNGPNMAFDNKCVLNYVAMRSQANVSTISAIQGSSDCLPDITLKL